MKRFLILALSAVTLISCQFNETMVLNEDGSGRMSISMDLKELMAMTNEFEKDSTLTRTDTIIQMRDVLEAKKDSIATLPQADQDRLKRIENFSFRTLIDPDTNEMVIDVFTDFKNVVEANELLSAFQSSSDYLPGLGDGMGNSDEVDNTESELIGVNYSFKKNKFVRDAYIKDPERHAVQMDSLKSLETFMSGMQYKLSYTFPTKVKSANIPDAKLSLDGKTLEIERSFLDYFKNPDVLDLEVELEK